MVDPVQGKKGNPYLFILYYGMAGIFCHSVLERIWIKGSYPSQWLPQGERGPPKESKSRWIEIPHGGSQEQKKNLKFFLD